MEKLTKEQRHEIYKLAYKIHLEDIQLCKETEVILFGMCKNIKDALDELGYDNYSIFDLPEFIALKPKDKEFGDYWWDRKNTNVTRKKKYKLLINQTS